MVMDIAFQLDNSNNDSAQKTLVVSLEKMLQENIMDQPPAAEKPAHLDEEVLLALEKTHSTNDLVEHLRESEDKAFPSQSTVLEEHEACSEGTVSVHASVVAIAPELEDHDILVGTRGTVVKDHGDGTLEISWLHCDKRTNVSKLWVRADALAPPLVNAVRAHSLHFMGNVLQSLGLQECIGHATILLDALCMNLGPEAAYTPAFAITGALIAAKFHKQTSVSDRFHEVATLVTRVFGCPNQVAMRVLRQAELQFLNGLSWRIKLPSIQTWCLSMLARMAAHTGNFTRGTCLVRTAQPHVAKWSDHFMLHVQATGRTPPRILALGAFSLGLVSAGLFSIDKLCPQHVSLQAWHGTIEAAIAKAPPEMMTSHAMKNYSAEPCFVAAAAAVAHAVAAQGRGVADDAWQPALDHAIWPLVQADTSLRDLLMGFGWEQDQFKSLQNLSDLSWALTHGVVSLETLAEAANTTIMQLQCDVFVAIEALVGSRASWQAGRGRQS